MEPEHTQAQPKPLDLEKALARDPTDHVAEAFQAGGHLAKVLPGYLPRTGQIEMAYVVEEAMQGGHNAIIEAPTGVGKSAAYGVLGSRLASKGERVVVVTANIALQEQLYRKDFPMLEEALPWPFTFALAKGLSNYLCLAGFEESSQDVIKGHDLTHQEREQWQQITRWAGTTTTGDLSELPFEPAPKVRLKFTTTSEDCPGRKCPKYNDCHAHRARAAVRRAQVVITNYAMFFSDLMIRGKEGEGILPRYSHVVLDEAHKAAALCRDHIGYRVARGTISHVARLLNAPADAKSKKGWLPAIAPALKSQLTRSADAFFFELSKVMHSKRYNIRFRRPWEDPLLGVAVELCDLLRTASRTYSEAAGTTGLNEVRQHELIAMATRCSEQANHISAAAKQEAAGWVHFLLDEGERKGISLQGKPVSVAEYLRTMLFEKKEGKNAVKSVIATSATLCTTVEDFSYVSRELGIRDADELTVESPFDIRANTLVVTPPMVDPSHRDFASEVARRITQVVEQSQGRALCLFTSHKVMEQAYQEVRNGKHGAVPYTLLKQGQAPRTQLIKRFRDDVGSVLFGTESFWAGVDVPGESLSVVVIDRLPFPNISDPLQDYLKEKMGRRYFREVSVPVALIACRQGVGRLLRSVTDRGAVVMLDNRVQAKGYGRDFLRTFPQGTRVTKDIAEIGRFLKAGS